MKDTTASRLALLRAALLAAGLGAGIGGCSDASETGAENMGEQLTPTDPGSMTLTGAPGAAFNGRSMTSQNGQFTVEFDATPRNAPMDAVVALSKGAQSTWTGLAAIVRFDDAGAMDARNGSTYRADVSLKYRTGVTYHVREAVDVPAHTYSVYVTPPGSAEILLASNYAFRTEQQSVTSLDWWSLGATSGTLEVTNFRVVTAVSPVPAPTPAPAPPSTGTGGDAGIPAARRIDWSAGIPGGIPARTTICANVKTAYGAKGDGVTDDTAAIRNAINACPANQVVYIPAGTYKLTGALSVTGKGIVIRGDGPGLTKLVSHATSGDVISFTGNRGTAAANIVSGYTQGSTSITVDNAASFAVGDYVIADELNDPALVSSTGSNGTCTWASRNGGARAMGQVVKIAAKSGNTLTLGRPLYLGFSAAYSPQIIALSPNSPKNAGVEDLHIERMGAGDGNTIGFTRTVYSWVKNVESRNGFQHHVYLWTTYGSEIRDSVFHRASSFAGGYGYGVRFAEGGSDTLVENNVLYYLRHSVIFGGGGSGNVIGYNYSARVFDDRYPNTNWLMGDILMHGAHPYMNLVEGNIVAHILADNVWGSSSHNTYFRNHVERQSQGETVAQMSYALWAADFDEKNLSVNFVGNVLCKSGCAGAYESYPVASSGDGRIYRLGMSGSTGSPSDSRVSSTFYRHGNFDYLTNATAWDPTKPDHTLPASLYLTTRPAFFGANPWPAIGPDVAAKVGVLPAKQRFALLANP